MTNQMWNSKNNFYGRIFHLDKKKRDGSLAFYSNSHVPNEFLTETISIWFWSIDWKFFSRFRHLIEISKAMFVQTLPKM